jgi:hypothetical protein
MGYNFLQAGRLSERRTDATQGTLDYAYHNLWVLRFTTEGQCRSFTEWYIKAPGTP